MPPNGEGRPRVANPKSGPHANSASNAKASIAGTADGPPDCDAIRAAALRAAERGWHPFPTSPGQKVPRRGLSWPAAACADLRRLSAATWHPGEGYGIACKPSGLVVVDLDRWKRDTVLPAAWQDVPGITDGADVLAELASRAGQSWPLTRWVRTPTGGHHLYYVALPGRAVGNSQGRLGPMIDVRGGGGGDGGYVLGVGTVLDERAYPDDPIAAAMVRGGKAYELIHDQDPEPLPGWLADLLDPPQRPSAAPHVIPPRPGLRRSDVPPGAYGRMCGVLDRLAAAQPGEGRNAVLHWAACRFGELVTAGKIDAHTAESALYMAAVANGHVAKHGERGTCATIRSGLRQAAAA
jgi:hypothetical protein